MVPLDLRDADLCRLGSSTGMPASGVEDCLCHLCLTKQLSTSLLKLSFVILVHSPRSWAGICYATGKHAEKSIRSIKSEVRGSLQVTD